MHRMHVAVLAALVTLGLGALPAAADNTNNGFHRSLSLMRLLRR